MVLSFSILVHGEETNRRCSVCYCIIILSFIHHNKSSEKCLKKVAVNGIGPKILVFDCPWTWGSDKNRAKHEIEFSYFHYFLQLIIYIWKSCSCTSLNSAFYSAIALLGWVLWWACFLRKPWHHLFVVDTIYWKFDTSYFVHLSVYHMLEQSIILFYWNFIELLQANNVLRCLLRWWWL